MPDPESSTDRDDGLRRGSTFKPADDRMWELPVDAPDQPAAGGARSPNWIALIGVIVIIAVVVVLITRLM